MIFVVFQRYLRSCEKGLKKLRGSNTFVLNRSSHTLISCIMCRSIFIIYGLMIHPHNDQLPVGLIAQLMEQHTGIAEVRVREPRSGRMFSGLRRNFLSSAKIGGDHKHLFQTAVHMHRFYALYIG